MLSDYQNVILLTHARVKDSFKWQDSSKDFNVTKYIDTGSDSMLQLSFEKLSLVEF